MTDDIEQGPDPNDVRRHAKKMWTEREYRLRYRRLDFYKPNRAQLRFHNTIADERMLRAGNQLGKTHSVGAELAMHACQIYFDGTDGWWKGRKFLTKPHIERPFDFIGWAGSTTSLATRDGIQAKLLGDIRSQGGLGSGLIPLDSIVARPTMARGITDLVDTVTIRREDGGTAIIRQKTAEQERRAWQGESVDVTWLDEDFGTDEVYGEVQARSVATRGIIMVSMTPMLGLSPIRKRFKEKLPGTAEILMTIDDALVSNGGHIPDEDIERLKSKFKASELQTRLYGADMMGAGAVFETPVEFIKKQFDPREFPSGWRWLWALDFRHSGNASGGHPFAAVLGCHSASDGDVIYIVDAFRMHGYPEMHAARIKSNRDYARAPVGWPHDGGRGASLVAGGTIAQEYKKAGLHMLSEHATFPGGGFNFEAGITEMENRFATGRLVVRSNLAEFFDEYQGYHRVNGAVHKVDDDLLSATRVLCMAIRFAQTKDRFYGWNADPRSRSPAERFAIGSANHPGGSYDLFGV
jgi:phage terminase large subunit-like protein